MRFKSFSNRQTNSDNFLLTNESIIFLLLGRDIHARPSACTIFLLLLLVYLQCNLNRRSIGYRSTVTDRLLLNEKPSLRCGLLYHLHSINQRAFTQICCYPFGVACPLIPASSLAKRSIITNFLEKRKSRFFWIVVCARFW